MGILTGHPKCELYGMGTVPSAPAGPHQLNAVPDRSNKYILRYFKVDFLVTILVIAVGFEPTPPDTSSKKNHFYGINCQILQLHRWKSTKIGKIPNGMNQDRKALAGEENSPAHPDNQKRGHMENNDNTITTTTETTT